VLFGFGFGALMTNQGIWSSQIPPFRQALVAGVELPATTLLYLYLRQLARQVPGRERRATLDQLVWAAPLVMMAGAVLVGAQWWMSTLRPFARPPMHGKGAALVALTARCGAHSQGWCR